MFKIKDKFLYEKYKGWTITSAFRSKAGSWRCTTKKGKYLIIRILGGTLQLSASEREHNAIFGGEVVAYAESERFDFADPQKIKEFLSIGLSGGMEPPASFADIAEFFDWRYDEDDVWDI